MYITVEYVLTLQPFQYTAGPCILQSLQEDRDSLPGPDSLNAGQMIW